jgi:hypothetical protein
MRVGPVLAALAIAMLAFAGTADAKKKHKKKVAPVVSATATASGSTEGQTVTATATCPSGTKAVGGGFSTPPLSPMPDSAGAAIASRKVGASQWVASMVVEGTPGSPLVLTTAVYCRKGAPATTPVSTTSSLPDSTGPPITPTQANATCPAGQVQLSGGFAIDTVGPALVLSSSRLDPLTWQVTGVAGDPGHTITSQADCAKQPKKKKGKKGKKKVKKLVTPTEVIGTATSNTAVVNTTPTATCPPKTFAVNGGFSQPGAVSSATSSFLFVITESQAVGNTWHVSGFNESPNPGTLRSHVYCSR